MLGNPINFCSWNPESWDLEFGIQLKESGIQRAIGPRNPSFTDKVGNPVPGIRNPRAGIQKRRLSWISVIGATSYLNELCHEIQPN